MKRLKTYLLLFLFQFSFTLVSPPACAQALQGAALKDSLLHALTHAKDDTFKIKTLLALGNAYAGSDSTMAIKYGNEAKQLSEKYHWEKGLGLYYLLMTKVYRNNINACLQNAREAYLILDKTDEKKSTAAALVYMGNCYQATGFDTKSMESNLAALAIYESIGNYHGTGVCYTNIGVAYYDLHKYVKAIENYKKALVVKTKENDKFGIGSDLDNIAMVYFDRGNYDSADVYDLAGVKMFEAVNDQPGLGRIYTNRGNILMKMYDAKSAGEYYRRSLVINQKLHVEEGISSAYACMGGIYLALAKDSSGKYKIAPFMKKDKKILLDSAEFYVTKAVTWAYSANAINLLMSNNLLLSEIEERLGHYHTALVSHQQYTLYKDSIFNDENKQKIASMENERLTQTKDQEIALQLEETRRQALLNKVILIGSVAVVVMIAVFVLIYNRRKKARFDKEVMEVEMKALRAQMNPHFISNALHSINKYVMENDKKNASGYLAKFASLMRLILENSREREVPLEQDLHALELYIQMEQLRFNNKFSYHIDVDPDIDPENTLVPPMLLQPFAENAILHGLHNKENGVVSIRVRKQNNMICCIIEDNGNGNADAVSPAQVNGTAHKSFGKKIINERLNIINRLKKAKATVNILQLKDAANQPGGVRVELFLPIELAF